MNLIDFLLDNIVLVFIVIGGIFSFFNRMAEENKKNQQPPAKPVRRDDAGANQEEKHSDFPPFLKKIEQQIEMAKEQLEKRTSIPLDRPQTSSVEETKSEQDSRPTFEGLPIDNIVNYNEVSNINESPVLGEMNSLTRTPSSESSFKKMDRKVSKNKIREAIIWSEIIGPPRAKRSLHSKH
ncbi:hypothetical protein [Bacillus kwashiorkori]|uniref:hypothetical protein n=1 Tax=Bacillus kwashiorkori TaxID=1522318 RepID=UPI0007813189|nr:hypothetical protein [Bacillus kwashiorkori]